MSALAHALPSAATDDLIALVREAASAPVAVPGPFGPRRMIYADYTASGRQLGFIEEAIRDRVAPYYANTHTESSFSGRQTNVLREGAREAIRRAVGADQRHAVIFTGTGATGAVNRLISAMGLRLPPGARERQLLLDGVPEAERPVVFVGPYEHHSNELPWRESLVTVVRIKLDDEGFPCRQTLATELSRYADRKLKLGAFSGASNVTGCKTDIRPLARLMHEAGGYCIVDYAAGAPYMPIDMAETRPGAGDQLDAIFFSPHKFIGGPGASGVVVADKAMFMHAIPSMPGGGTVRFVTPEMHSYLDDIEVREEAGTPGIISDIRAGMVVQLKDDIGVTAIEAAEQRFIERALKRWRQVPGIEILGPGKEDRLAIFSFNIRIGERMLHHSLVVAMLNDLFGIQARGGCSCAGPYGHDLLGIDAALSERYRAQILAGHNLFKPGWVRLGFNYFFDDETVEAIIAAVEFIASRGKDLLALYDADVEQGIWRAGAVDLPQSFATVCGGWSGAGRRPAAVLPSLPQVFAEATRLADRARDLAVEPMKVQPELEALRWFHLPGE